MSLVTDFNSPVEIRHVRPFGRRKFILIEDKIEVCVSQPTQLQTSIIVIYVTLGLLLIALPSPVIARLQDVEPNAFIEFGKNTLIKIGDLSDKLGVQPAFYRARNRFLNGSALQKEKLEEGLTLRHTFDD